MKLAAVSRIAVVAFVTALITAFVATGSHQTPARAPLNANDITVSGHWVVEVREPDGTLAARRESDNHLVMTGSIFLADLLARRYSLGYWSIHVEGSSGSNPCFEITRRLCIIEETGQGFGAGNEFETLIVSRPPAGDPNANRVVLAGSMTAQVDGDIRILSTNVTLCPSTGATGCSRADQVSGANVTQLVYFPGPTVPVVTGQQVNITIALGFSAAPGAP